jgi:hypothetical protein
MPAIDIRPGTVLPNGATVIAASLRNAHEWIVLAMDVRDPEHVDYITWKCPRPGDGSGTTWGHYFQDLGEAVEDFKTRA